MTFLQQHLYMILNLTYVTTVLNEVNSFVVNCGIYTFFPFQVFSRLASDTGEPAPKNVGLRTNVTLSVLQPYKHYNVSVQALTGAGGGEKSYVLVMTDESGESRARGGFHSSFLGRGVVMV